jgi:hypothetical protein
VRLCVCVFACAFGGHDGGRRSAAG